MSPYWREMSTYLREMSTYLREMSTYLREMSTYLREMSTYLRETSTYLREMSTYLREMSTYLREMSTYLIVGRGGRVVERRTFGRRDRVQNHLLPFQNLGKFVHPTLLVSFGRDTKSRWSLLPGVYARGSKRSHTGGKCVTCCGLKEWWSLSLTHQFPARERRRTTESST